MRDYATPTSISKEDTLVALVRVWHLDMAIDWWSADNFGKAFLGIKLEVTLAAFQACHVGPGLVAMPVSEMRREFRHSGLILIYELIFRWYSVIQTLSHCMTYYQPMVTP